MVLAQDWALGLGLMDDLAFNHHHHGGFGGHHG